MGQDKPDIDTIRARRDEVAERHGPWTSHDIQLAEGLSTRPGGADLDRLRRCLQIASDLLRRPLGELRVLDLGALEGQYAVEFAAHGAAAVAIEGREANIEKARVAKEALGLDRLELLQEDVRALSRERHGAFDVVLCIGLLYHLDADDVFPFLGQLADVCDGVLILDTHVALRGAGVHEHGATNTAACASPSTILAPPPTSARARCGPRWTTRRASGRPGPPCWRG